MKHWKITYSVRYNVTGEVEEHEMFVKADNIIDAIKTAADHLSKEPYEANTDLVIWNAGIMEDDVF